jgi:hypothetical protein
MHGYVFIGIEYFAILHTEIIGFSPLRIPCGHTLASSLSSVNLFSFVVSTSPRKTIFSFPKNNYGKDN